MREIKFRAFDKNQEKVLPVNSLKSICIHSERLTEDEFDNLIIMQFTGLYDKNGVEIYEGDIIEIDLLEYKNEFAKVAFENGAFGYISHSRFTIFYHMKSMNYFTIVGNIYQNPELLK